MTTWTWPPASAPTACTCRPVAWLNLRPAGLEWVGASCHTRAELEQAATLGLDYALLGAVNPPPAIRSATALGWDAFADLIRALRCRSSPWAGSARTTWTRQSPRRPRRGGHPEFLAGLR
jgi:hypothetical protein